MPSNDLRRLSTPGQGSQWAKGAKMNRPPEYNPNVHGEIPGSPVGSTFSNRIACSEAGVHGPWRAGIHGNQADGAFSVVLSGGYEDDEDNGETITYTGQGGRDTRGSKIDQMEGKTLWEGPQSADQEWIRGNKALKISCATKKPIRVVRGHSLNSQYAPAEGYRYDGLYQVVEAWRAEGKTGFKTCRFTFQRLPGQPPIPGMTPQTRITKSLLSSPKVPPSTPAPAPSKPPTAKRPKPNSGNPHTKETTWDERSVKRPSAFNGSNSSNLVTPHTLLDMIKAGPSKPRRINDAASSSRQPSRPNRLIPRPLEMSPLFEVKVEPIHALITPRPTPSASARSSKRRHNDSDDDTVDSRSDNPRGLKRPEFVTTPGASRISLGGGRKWATIEGIKKYEGLHFKKKKIEK